MVAGAAAARSARAARRVGPAGASRRALRVRRFRTCARRDWKKPERGRTLVGANMRPPRHMLPKAPWPARWVPPPGTRGIRDTARPVPQDSAAVW